MLRYSCDRDGVAVITLDDPQRRNALDIAMFDALDEAVRRAASDSHLRVVVLAANGSAFCAGFDLEAAVADPTVMATYILRLSGVIRALRRMEPVVIARVQGAALAGGCALLSACDFVVVEAAAKLGYPVHRIGVSPAVTIPTLTRAIGTGRARSLLLGGDLIDGREAVRIGLATHLASGPDDLTRRCDELVTQLLEKGPIALRATKAWLNELDGSLDDQMFDDAAQASAALAGSSEATAMLELFWRSRK